ncbi:pyridoxal-phosphate dependent enzyme [Alginatibacterium sediminis]|uniref:Pyridoxal-phosphate dependent enzyme n=1 Tax=Alginatibacterium sediminis TaxID=2164068 RepID=A0A420EHX6_9ALTE|nr:pyridoxal-phosphate dependent enzyme [Alginatibacterium sediminis]RKF20341.1 pyridoxal-phosphate dependent enzyme [Alginatibacterium sediminis]
MDNLQQHPISLLEMYKAKQVVSRYIAPSALIKYDDLSKLLGFNVYIKHENQNRTGSFKIRGGINLMSHLKSLGVNGVVTFSTGNHGLSIATAAKLFDLPAIVVVPLGANPLKMKLIQAAGAEVVEAGSNFDESSLVVSEISQIKGYYYAHPANEPHIINGVGTQFVDLMDQLPDMDAVILPLGGGSEVAAAVTSLKPINPEIDIYAVQAELSCAAYHSWKQAEILHRPNQTFAGGFATGMAYQTTFDIYKQSLSDFVLLSEHEILQGIALAAYYTRNVVEGAGSSTIMAAWKLRKQLAGKNVVLQFSGSNASVEELNRAYALACFSNGLID